MAGSPEAKPRESVDIRAARWWESKSAGVGLVAFGVGLLVPPIAPLAFRVAGVEGLEFVGTKIYIDMRERKEYSVKTRREAVLAA